MINLIRTKEIKSLIAAQPDKVKEIVDGEKEIGICITNSQGYFVYMNDRYLQIYSYKREDMVGKHFTLVVSPDKQDYMKELHDKFIRDQYEILRQWKVVDSNGDMIDIQVDAGYNDKIFDATPHKITFVHIE